MLQHQNLFSWDLSSRSWDASSSFRPRRCTCHTRLGSGTFGLLRTPVWPFSGALYRGGTISTCPVTSFQLSTCRWAWQAHQSSLCWALLFSAWQAPPHRPSFLSLLTLDDPSQFAAGWPLDHPVGQPVDLVRRSQSGSSGAHSCWFRRSKAWAADFVSSLTCRCRSYEGQVDPRKLVLRRILWLPTVRPCRYQWTDWGWLPATCRRLLQI